MSKPENHRKHWTTDDERTVLETVREAETLGVGMGKACNKVGRYISSVINRFTLTRLLLERAIYKMEQGDFGLACREIGLIGNEYSRNIDIEFYAKLAMTNYGDDKIFSENVLMNSVKRKLKGSNRNNNFRDKFDRRSTLLIDEE